MAVEVMRWSFGRTQPHETCSKRSCLSVIHRLERVTRLPSYRQDDLLAQHPPDMSRCSNASLLWWMWRSVHTCPIPPVPSTVRLEIALSPRLEEAFEAHRDQAPHRLDPEYSPDKRRDCVLGLVQSELAGYEMSYGRSSSKTVSTCPSNPPRVR